MDALTIAAVSLQNDIQRVAQVGHNLVNVSTPGYKRVQGVPGALSYQSLQAMQQALSQSPSTVTASLDMTAAALATTGRTTDLAIQGEGFFVLQSEKGAMFDASRRFPR
ncbi:MAG: hypothetical protein QM776_13410 [Rhodocyclaceae bacterium]